MASVLAWHIDTEQAGGPCQSFQVSLRVHQYRLTEAGAHVSDVDQGTLFVVGTEKKRSDPACPRDCPVRRPARALIRFETAPSSPYWLGHMKNLADYDPARTTLAVRRGTRYGITAPFRLLGITAQQLRVDRILDEAAHAGDLVQLMRVSVLGFSAAVRYVRAAHPEKVRREPTNP